MSEIRKFNRHASMNAETRRGILELIHDLNEVSIALNLENK